MNPCMILARSLQMNHLPILAEALNQNQSLRRKYERVRVLTLTLTLTLIGGKRG